MSILIEIGQVTIEKMFKMCLQTDHRQYVIRIAHLSFQLTWAKNCLEFLSSLYNEYSINKNNLVDDSRDRAIGEYSLTSLEFIDPSRSLFANPNSGKLIIGCIGYSGLENRSCLLFYMFYYMRLLEVYRLLYTIKSLKVNKKKL